jgi:phenylalanyl-tRNA synthetase beta chain
MGIESKVEGDAINVTVPFYRNDILHSCDIAEDIAIAYGYNNIAMPVP